MNLSGSDPGIDSVHARSMEKSVETSQSIINFDNFERNIKYLLPVVPLNNHHAGTLRGWLV
ncbi:hypothetical protein SAMN05216564_105133 [Halopenitus persicus]|uniref:Uncharacterized protein n=1 Tax=Halopenitus persicus TaxID=1048396 RepID=A0A1H3JT26_9EURY|nr:hypothetical protein SAMN05216564_105133 [Halopenitus persicus]